MKGSLLWKLMYVFCALAGCLAGCGIVSLTGSGEHNPNTITKDNTLVREYGDGVFFVERKTEVPSGEEAENMPAEKVEPAKETNVPEVILVPTQAVTPTIPTEVPATPEPLAGGEYVPVEPELGQAVLPPAEDMPSLSSQWVNAGLTVVPEINPTMRPSAGGAGEAEPLLPEVQSQVTETITYPAEIFGQVPVINRSDTYVSYFEFAYDLITMLEPEVKERGLNMNSLITRFVIKALFCGVDIEKLDINAPIPRRLAALCLWLAAQVLNETGSDTSAKSAQQYVIDIARCSSAEKKAVAYLYEQGILKGYQTKGQQFYPDAGLTTESGNTWLSRVKQCWN